MNPTFRNSQVAFADAIAQGTLSVSRDADAYAGNYMYMGTANGRDAFKNINTREYLFSEVPDFDCGNYDPQDATS
jgi:hypothetical protein